MFMTLITFVRPLLGCTLLIAAVGKMMDPHGTRRAIAAYSAVIRSSPLSDYLARVLPFGELALGTLLVCQILPIISSTSTLLLWLLFLGVVLRIRKRNSVMDCHCFGAFTREPLSALTVIRLAVLLALTSGVVFGDVYAALVHESPSVDPTFGSPQARAVIAVIAFLSVMCLMLFGQAVATLRAVTRAQPVHDSAARLHR